MGEWTGWETLTKPTKGARRALANHCASIARGEGGDPSLRWGSVGAGNSWSAFQLEVLQKSRGHGQGKRPLTCPHRQRGLRLSALGSPACLALLRCCAALSPAAPAASPARDPPPSAARVPLRSCLRAGGSSSASQSGPAPPLLSVPRSPLALPTPLLHKFVSLG